MSYVEVYKEELIDLPSSSTKPDLRNYILLGALQVPVRNKEEVLERIIEGEKRRHVDPTTYNSKSSRSHCVLRLYIESSDSADAEMARVSQLVSTAHTSFAVLTTVLTHIPTQSGGSGWD